MAIKNLPFTLNEKETNIRIYTHFPLNLPSWEEGQLNFFFGRGNSYISFPSFGGQVYSTTIKEQKQQTIPTRQKKPTSVEWFQTLNASGFWYPPVN